jgi:hypothetical protein
MANYCFVAPLLPGGIEKMKTWNQDDILNNANHDRVFKAAGITREQVWLQHTPMGDFAVASFEVDDARRAFKSLAASSDPWAARFRSFLMEAHGFDLAHSGEPNEQLIDWCIEERVLG